MGRVQLMHRFALYVRCSYLHPSSSRFLPEFAGQEGSTQWMGGLRHIRQRTKHDVILTAPMERLGQAGQIVKVAPGYARNRLIPEMLALPAIEKFVLLVQNQLKQVGAQVGGPEVEEKVHIKEVTEEDKLKDIDAVLGRLAKGRVVLKRDVGMKTTLMKLVTKSDIVSEVRRQLGVDLQEGNIQLDAAFSTVGDFEVPILLPAGLKFKLPGDKKRLLLRVRIRRK